MLVLEVLCRGIVFLLVGLPGHFHKFKWDVAVAQKHPPAKYISFVINCFFNVVLTAVLKLRCALSNSKLSAGYVVCAIRMDCIRVARVVCVIGA